MAGRAALVREKEAGTAAAAVARVLADTPELAREQVAEPDSPTRSGESATFCRCSVVGLSRRMAAPATVELIAALPPADARLATFSDLAALATRALTREGAMVAAIDTGRLVCDAMVGGRSSVVLAAIRGGCAFIGADEDQSRIYRVLQQRAGAVTGSPPPDQERPERR